MWRLVILLWLVTDLNCGAEISANIGNGERSLDSDTVCSDLHSEETTIRQAASRITNARSIEELTKEFELFYQKFSANLLKDDSINPIINKEFQKIARKGKRIFAMAKKYENSSKTARERQITDLEYELTDFKNHVHSFKTSLTQGKVDIKIYQSKQKDVNGLNDVKRFFNVIDFFSETIRVLQSIHRKIICFVYGNCEASDGESTNDNSAGNDDYSDDDSDDDEQDEDVEDPDEEQEDEDPAPPELELV